MLEISKEKSFDHEKKSLSFNQGVLDVMPLSISVLPWEILAGSIAMQAGLSVSQAIAQCLLWFL